MNFDNLARFCVVSSLFVLLLSFLAFRISASFPFICLYNSFFRPRMKKEVDERLAIEAHVLSKLQHSKHVCKLFQFGRTISYT